jgi:hypothetical protein
MRSVLLLLALLPLATAEPAPAWDYRPLVTYEDEGLVATLAGDGRGSWRLDDGAGATVPGSCTVEGGQVRVEVSAAGHDRVRLRGSDGREAVLCFVRPGHARDLTLGEDGLPLLGGLPAVLVLSRLEARADRRWALLREGIDARPLACAAHLAPPSTAQGRPVLLAECVASQAIDPAGGVLVELSGLDRVAGWKHREYRQVLAWLVCDLQARDAGHVALAPPYAAAIHADSMSPLRLQVTDVANAYRCRVVDTLALSDPSYWELQPGLLGTGLNASGAAVRDALFAPWLAATAR